ncbi:hypothetical protein SMD22_01400 (plasmid) [Brevibacillus halotolerans]|nr:hypothetical protein SMD22_01400 [Brevibacillus halotolerans]
MNKAPISNESKGLDCHESLAIIIMIIFLGTFCANHLFMEYKSNYLKKYAGDLIEVTNEDSYPKTITYQYRGSKDSPLFGQNRKYALRHEGRDIKIEQIKELDNAYEIVNGENTGKKLNPNDLPDDYLGVLDFTNRDGSFKLTIPNKDIEYFLKGVLSKDINWYDQVKYNEENKL